MTICFHRRSTVRIRILSTLTAIAAIVAAAPTLAQYAPPQVMVAPSPFPSAPNLPPQLTIRRLDTPTIHSAPTPVAMPTAAAPAAAAAAPAR